jgi:predicted phage-related endonuclease
VNSHETLQRNDSWRNARAGVITASRFKDVMEFSEPDPGEVFKSGPRKGQSKPFISSAARDKYMRELCFERLSGKPVHEVTGMALRWGTEVEMYSLSAFEVETGLVVQPACFVTHPEYPFIGCSADGLIGKDGGCENKSPHDEAVHIRTMLEGMPEDHVWQVQGCMFVTGRKWWEFISYDPRAAEAYRLYHQRIERDEEAIRRLKDGIIRFEAELSLMVATLQRKTA